MGVRIDGERGVPVIPAAPATAVRHASTKAKAPAATAADGAAIASRPAGTVPALSVLPDPAAQAAFQQRFGSDQPLPPERTPLADLLAAMALPTTPDGLGKLWTFVGTYVPGGLKDMPTAQLDATAFQVLSRSLDKALESWDTGRGWPSYRELDNIHAVQRFVSGQAELPIRPTVGQGPVLTAAVTEPCHGVRLEAPAGVSEKAVQAARDLIARLVTPETAARMEKAGVEAVVVPTNALMTEIPQFHALHEILTADGRPWKLTRGVGDVLVDGRHAVALPEESLLQDRRHDPQPAGYSAALHEFAHMVLRVGVTDERRRAITTHYTERAQAKGDFTDAYAATNVDEYFAQASCAFFGVNKGQGKDRAFLEAEDPWLFEQLKAIYPQPDPVASPPATP